MRVFGELLGKLLGKGFAELLDRGLGRWLGESFAALLEREGLLGTVLLGGVATCIYLIPWIVAASRETRNRGTIAVVNILLGWTFIGWVIALAMAFGEMGQGSNEG